MSEIELVKRLRKLPGLCDPECYGRCVDCPQTAMSEAADAIEALTAALESAEEWLNGWASAEPYLDTIRAALRKVRP